MPKKEQRFNPFFNFSGPNDGGNIFNVEDTEENIQMEAFTSRGLIKYTVDKDGVTVQRPDRGVGVHYDMAGDLDIAIVDIFAFGNSMNEEQLGLLPESGAELVAMLGELYDDKIRLFVEADLINGGVNLVKIDLKNDTRQVVGRAEEVSFADYFLKISFGEMKIVAEMAMSEGDLKIGVGVESGGEMGVVEDQISIDANCKTFMLSDRPDRLDRLAKRIFIN